MLSDKDQNKLNEYLGKIESALKNISVADRSDILLELDGHIKESVESNNQSLDEILAALGDPLMVANRYLVAKGAKTVTPPKFRWVRNLTLGFVAVVSLAIVSVIMLVSSFTPILSVDEEKGRVTILGGLVDVDEKNGRVSIGKGLINVDGEELEISGMTFSGKEIAGSVPVTSSTKLHISAYNGKWKVEGTDDRDLTYQCKVGGATKDLSDVVIQTKNQINFNLGDSLRSGSKCRIDVPKNVSISINAVNGKIEMEDLEQSVTAKLKNGKVKFEKKEDVKYFFRTIVREGKLHGDNLNSPLPKPEGAYSVNIEVDRGKVIVE